MLSRRQCTLSGAPRHRTSKQERAPTYKRRRGVPSSMWCAMSTVKEFGTWLLTAHGGLLQTRWNAFESC